MEFANSKPTCISFLKILKLMIITSIYMEFPKESKNNSSYTSWGLLTSRKEEKNYLSSTENTYIHVKIENICNLLFNLFLTLWTKELLFMYKLHQTPNPNEM
jgi:hypothetical protein